MDHSITSIVHSFLLLLAFNLSLHSQINIESVSGLTYGNNPVGFQFMKLYDSSRSGIWEQDDKSKRIVPLYLWYPASNAKSTANPNLTLKDYIQCWALETDYHVSNGALRAQALQQYKKTFFWNKDTTSFHELYELNLHTKAIENEPIQEGQFPLVVLIHGTLINWQFMAEYLASQGFVVAFVPVTGTYDKRLEEGISGVETELRDVEFIIGHLATIPQVDTKRIVSIGHSLGSLAAMGLATKNQAVKAVVSLDGVIGAPNEGALLYKMPYFSNHRFTSPLLHFTGGFSYSNSMTQINQLQFSNRYILEMTGMRHSDFLGQGLYDTLGVKLSGPAVGNYQGGFRLVNEYILAFLKSHLIDSTNHFDQLFKDTNYGDSLVLKRIKKEKQDKNYQYAELIELVFHENFDRLFEIYHGNKNLDIKAFSYDTFHDIGMFLYYRNHREEALEWIGYFASSYPQSAKASYLLGNFQRILEKQQLAIINLKRAQSLMKEDLWLSPGQKIMYLNRLENILKQLEED